MRKLLASARYSGVMSLDTAHGASIVLLVQLLRDQCISSCAATSSARAAESRVQLVTWASKAVQRQAAQRQQQR